MPQVTIGRHDEELDVDPGLCLGCAGTAATRCRVWFEPEPSVTFVSSLGALKNRVTLDVPVCPDCLSRKSRLRWITVLWICLGLVLLFVPGMIAIAGGLLPRDVVFDDWRVWVAGFVVSWFPFDRALVHWQAKDRGGFGLDLVDSDNESVTLVLADAVALRVMGEGRVIDIPTVAELAEAIAGATRSAVARLFREHPGSYYYVSLITTGEGHAPRLAAWSKEALAEAGDETLKWSYADSPYYCFGETYYEPVDSLFARRLDVTYGMTEDEWDEELDARLEAMESALAQLDAEGVFGQGAKRLQVVVNAEVMPPDRTNTERAERLNPPEALVEWLAEVAE